MVNCPTSLEGEILILTCPTCAFHTLVLQKFFQHVASSHTGVEAQFSLFQCTYCKRIASSSEVLMEHSSMLHSDRQASIIEVYPSANQQLDILINCLFCSHRSSVSTELTSHYLDVHGIRNVMNAGLWCSRLSGNAVTPAVKICKANEAVEHANVKPNGYASPLKFENVDSSDSQSLRTSHTTTTSSQPVLTALDETSASQPLRCHICGHEYSTRKYFAEHLISCSRSMQLTCVCGRVCKWRSNFYTHRKGCAVYKRLLAEGHCIPSRHRGGSARRSSSRKSSALSKQAPASNEEPKVTENDMDITPKFQALAELSPSTPISATSPAVSGACSMPVFPDMNGLDLCSG